MPTKLTG
jgi:hypothetical protein